MISLAVSSGVQTALSLAFNFAANLVRSQNQDSLVAFTKSTRVEPIVMIDETLAHRPYTTDVLSSLNSLFTGYYLQAVALSVNVDNVNAIRVLDSLNPKRDVNDATATLIDRTGNVALNSEALSGDHYQYRLPKVGSLSQIGYAMEAVNVLKANKSGNQPGNKTGEKPEDRGPSLDIKVDAYKSITEVANLSIGKMVEVEIGHGKHKGKFPVMVRLIATLMTPDTMAHILGDGSKNRTASERYHEWRSGAIQFWRDVVLATDLIDDHYKSLMKDKSGTYSEILDRRAGNYYKSALTKTPSIATASNLMVMSHFTAKKVEMHTGLRLSSDQHRAKLFANSYLMILTVIDTEHEQVTFYHRGIKLPTTLSLREIKVSNKGGGPDVTEILRAYMLGNQPTI